MGSSAPEHTQTAVIGAGIIGLAIAHRLACDGHDVVMIDPATPGHGASWGSAGMIADYAVLPVGTPEVLRNLPALLFNRTSPLAIRRAAMLSLAPWLLRFARQSLPARSRANAQVLSVLLAGSAERWRALAEAIGGADLLRANGCLHAFETTAERRAAERDCVTRRSLGVEVELISPADLHLMEPALAPMQGGGAFFPGALSIADPGGMTDRLAKAAAAAGVRLVSGRVTRIDTGAQSVRITGPGIDLSARRAVVAAGAHSRVLARHAGSAVPLDTERGYHLEFGADAPHLGRAVSPAARGFYLCPMLGRLRVAGTVELGGLRAPPSPHRLRVLEEGARAVLPGLPAPVRSWMGFRPSVPDSVPVIGWAGQSRSVMLAFGHGHLGVTLAPVTAQIVTDLLAGRDPIIAAATVSPDRF